MNYEDYIDFYNDRIVASTEYLVTSGVEEEDIYKAILSPTKAMANALDRLIEETKDGS